ncbi:MAG: hypothetical protein WC119_00965 [Synergistaceae bacterium]
MNKLLIEGTDLTLDIRRMDILAIIPQSKHKEAHKACGLNISIDYDFAERAFEEHMNRVIGGGDWVRCIIEYDDYRIPIDIHGGNINKSYFGYILFI